MDAAYKEEEPVSVSAPRRASRPAAQPVRSGQEQNTVFDALLGSKAFQDMVRATVLEVLRSREGQELLERTVRKELDRQRYSKIACKTVGGRAPPAVFVSGDGGGRGMEKNTPL